MTHPIVAWLKRHAALTIVLIAVAVVGIVRLRLGAVPLERDEGEYAYAGQLILHGIPPYGQVYNMKFPGTYYAYALILAIFGETPLGLHAGLLLVNAATTLLIFAIGRRIEGALFGAVAAVAFAVLSVDRCVFGVFGHATHFVLLPTLGALLILMRDRASPSPRWILGSGVLLGLAILMKQHAVLFVPLAAALVSFEARPSPSSGWPLARSRLLALAAGIAIPVTAACAFLLSQGVLGRFWFWTVRYAAAYVTEVPAATAPALFAEAWNFVTVNTLPFWIVAGFGLVALWATPWSTRTRLFVTGLLAASFLAICPGFYFRPHYFILLLPAVGFLVGVAVVAISRRLERILPRVAAVALAGSMFAALTASYAWPEREYLFTMTPREVSRSVYDVNPFIEAQEIANYIGARTNADDRIAVLGSEPEILFHAGRRSATGYIYMYPLVECQPYAARMQDEMIREIEAAGPKYLVLVKVDPSWLVRCESGLGVVKWGYRYAQQCFDLVGIMDIVSDESTTVLWDDEARAYTPISENVIYTFRRKNETPCTTMR
jgi:4-amino-4-deoxy-L-arabinose transferase-like glycosyltransferase